MQSIDKMEWVDYDGQPLEGYDYLGTESLQYPITEETDPEKVVEELIRRCGKSASIRLYREVPEDETR